VSDFRGKKILTVLLEFEYGRQELGRSCDRRWFYDPLVSIGCAVEAFWWDPWVERQEGLRSQLLAKIGAARPDLIVIVPFKDQFSPELLAEIRARVPTLAWFGDDHWRFESFTARQAPHFTHVVTTDPWAVPAYRALGIEPIVSDWASESIKEELPPHETSDAYRYDVTFVGGANEVRKWYVDRLRRSGIEVVCFGNGWGERVSVEQMRQIFRDSRISLNLSNSVQPDISFITSGPRAFARWLISKKRYEQVKARNFEIPLAGGFQLTQYALGLERHFHIGEEIAIYGNVEDCARQIRYYLAMPELRLAMAKAAYRRSRAQHTFEERFRYVLSEVWT
jgi:spore maturation protein CgeB